MPVSSRVCVSIGGTSFTLKKELLAEKSGVLCDWFKENPNAERFSLNQIPTTPEIFRVIARFCGGHQINFTPENIIPIISLACSLNMDDSHSPNNLFMQAARFFKKKIITGWNESLRALKAMENQMDIQHTHFFIGKCMDAIVNMALSDRRLLLGELVNDDCTEDEDSEDEDSDDEDSEDEDSEDEDSEEDDVVEEEEDLSLTTLHLKFYEAIILKMVESKMDSDDIATNLYQYAKRWVFFESKEFDENTSAKCVCSNSRKSVIEAIERLLPHDQSIVPCSSLSKMLLYARLLEASVICRDGFEVRIGRQLDLVTSGDLLIATHDCSKEEKYDTECVRRILKHFHASLTMKDRSKLSIVVELVKNYMLEAANDIKLKKESFVSLAEMLIAESEGKEGSSDGIYRAIDIYLSKHRDLKKSEREEICAILDCNKMSPEAREDAARNVWLPVGTVLQVLFAEQLKLREMVTKEKSKSTGDDSVNEKEVKMKLEKECRMLRKELENSKKENSLLRQLQLLNEEKGSSKVEEEDEDLIVYFGT